MRSEPSRTHAVHGEARTHPSMVSARRVRERIAQGGGELQGAARDVALMMRTEPETMRAPRRIFDVEGVTRGLGLDRGQELAIQRMVEDTPAEFRGLQRVVQARQRLHEALRAMGYDGDTRMELATRALAYWRHKYPTDNTRSPEIRVTKSLTIGDADELTLDELRVLDAWFPLRKSWFAFDGRSALNDLIKAKYIKRIATGDPKRPWRYIYPDKPDSKKRQRAGAWEAIKELLRGADIRRFGSRGEWELGDEALDYLASNVGSKNLRDAFTFLARTKGGKVKDAMVRAADKKLRALVERMPLKEIDQAKRQKLWAFLEKTAKFGGDPKDEHMVRVTADKVTFYRPGHGMVTVSKNRLLNSDGTNDAATLLKLAARANPERFAAQFRHWAKMPMAPKPTVPVAPAQEAAQGQMALDFSGQPTQQVLGSEDAPGVRDEVDEQKRAVRDERRDIDPMLDKPGSDPRDVSRAWVTGNTYPIKRQLKAAGFKWDRNRKAWYREGDWSRQDPFEGVKNLRGPKVAMDIDPSPNAREMEQFGRERENNFETMPESEGGPSGPRPAPPGSKPTSGSTDVAKVIETPSGPSTPGQTWGEKARADIATIESAGGVLTPKTIGLVHSVWMRDESLGVYAIPYPMRPGQQPRDIWDASPTKPPAGWMPVTIAPGWYGSMGKEEIALSKQFEAELSKRGLMPQGVNEWATLPNRPVSVDPDAPVPTPDEHAPTDAPEPAAQSLDVTAQQHKDPPVSKDFSADFIKRLTQQFDEHAQEVREGRASATGVSFALSSMVDSALAGFSPTASTVKNLRDLADYIETIARHPGHTKFVEHLRARAQNTEDALKRKDAEETARRVREQEEAAQFNPYAGDTPIPDNALARWREGLLQEGGKALERATQGITDMLSRIFRKAPETPEELNAAIMTLSDMKGALGEKAGQYSRAAAGTGPGAGAARDRLKEIHNARARLDEAVQTLQKKKATADKKRLKEAQKKAKAEFDAMSTADKIKKLQEAGSMRAARGYDTASIEAEIERLQALQAQEQASEKTTPSDPGWERMPESESKPKGAKLTAARAKALLAKETFRLHRDQTRQTRQATLVPGVYLKEYKPSKIVRGVLEARGPSTYEVVRYVGGERDRWRVESFDSLAAALKHANEVRTAATAAFEGESGEPTAQTATAAEQPLPGTPRAEAAAKTKEMLETEYVNDRVSRVEQRGEDVAGSARQKALEWSGASSSARSASADKIFTRKFLEKEFPLDLLSPVQDDSIDPSVGLAGAFAMAAFPKDAYVASVGTKNKDSADALKSLPDDQQLWVSPQGRITGGLLSAYRAHVLRNGIPNWSGKYRPSYSQLTEHIENASQEELQAWAQTQGFKSTTALDVKATLREAYYEAYKAVQEIVKDVTSTTNGTGRDALVEINNRVNDLLRQKRDQSNTEGTNEERSQAIAVSNALSQFLNQARKPGVSAPRGKLNNFDLMAREAVDETGLDAEAAAERLEEIRKEAALAVLEGESLNKAFGIATQRNVFKPKDVYDVNSQMRRRGPESEYQGIEQALDLLDKNAEGSKYKMRAIQWGKTVTDEEREHHLRAVVDSFADLADILGLPPELMSYNGRLAIAVGARGKAGALAHYEADKNIINLTRTGGAGALAHEWGHFFDFMVGELSGGRRDSAFEAPTKTGYSQRLPRPSRPVLAEMYDLRNSEGYIEFSRRVVEVAKKERINTAYWASHKEQFARCFERWVQLKLEKSGRQNTYLSGIAKSGIGDSAYQEMWPTDAEIEKMSPQFEALFAAFRKSDLLHKAMARAGLSKSVQRRLVIQRGL